MQENFLALPTQTELNGYVIDSVLGQGGFGVVYKAWHSRLEEWVVIKEFLPSELAGRVGNTIHPHDTERNSLFRECLDRFVIEGKTLVKLKHNHVVRCRDLFAANGTEYLVMDFEDGMPLDELIRAKEEKGEKYTERQLLPILISIAEGLDYIHSKGVLHRDIKPGNIFIRKENAEPVIIDFGAAKQNFAEVSQSQAPFTEFYAPIEQIEGIGEAAPTIDVHAFGAMMYRMVAGKIGPSAGKRALAFATGKEDPLESAKNIGQGHYSEEFLALIDDCLAFQAMNRPQSMSEVKKQLFVLRDDAQGEPSVNETTSAYVEKEIESAKKNNGTAIDAKSIKASEEELATNILAQKTDNVSHAENELKDGEAKGSLNHLVEDESHSDLSKKPKKVYFVAAAIAVLIGFAVLVYQQYVQSQYDKLMQLKEDTQVLHEELGAFSLRLSQDVIADKFPLVSVANYEKYLNAAPVTLAMQLDFYKKFKRELKQQLEDIDSYSIRVEERYQKAVKSFWWKAFWSGQINTLDVLEKINKAIEEGHPYAQIELGIYLLDDEMLGLISDENAAHSLIEPALKHLKVGMDAGDQHAVVLFWLLVQFDFFEEKRELANASGFTDEMIDIDSGWSDEKLRLIADQGYAVAQFCILLNEVENGEGYEREDYLRSMAKQGMLEAQLALGIELGALDDEGNVKLDSEGGEWIVKAAEGGHPEARYLLGWEFSPLDLSPKVVTSNTTAANNLYKLAVEKFWFERGKTTAPQLITTIDALLTYKQALDAGHPYVQVELAMLLSIPSLAGVDFDDQEAVYKLLYDGLDELGEAILAGDSHAIVLYVGLLELEVISEQKTKEVPSLRKVIDKGLASYLLAAANSGNLLAQQLLGNGVLNIEPNISWLIKSAENGFFAAQAQLAQSYEYGDNIDKDITRAIYWYQKAAKQGEESSQKRLSELGESW